MTYGIGRSRTRLVVLALLSLVLMGLDTYTDSLKQTRPIVGLIVVPVHLVAMIPGLILARANSLPLDVVRLQQDYQALKENRLLLNSRLQRFEAIEAENDRLRSLLSATGYTPDEVLLAEVVQVNVDPYSRTLLINRGTVEGVYEGQAALDANGLLGQVIRSGVFTSTVALITDSTQAIPVMSVRSGLHVLAYGTGQGNGLTIPFLEPTANLREGDVLVTSGLGQRFPRGYPVARVTRVVSSLEESFLRVTALPLAQLDSISELLLLWPAKPVVPFAIPPKQDPSSG